MFLLTGFDLCHFKIRVEQKECLRMVYLDIHERVCYFLHPRMFWKQLYTVTGYRSLSYFGLFRALAVFSQKF